MIFDKYDKYDELIKREREKFKRDQEVFINGDFECKKLKEYEEERLISKKLISKKIWFILIIVICFFVFLPFWVPIHIFSIIPPIVSGIAVCFSLYALFRLLIK